MGTFTLSEVNNAANAALLRESFNQGITSSMRLGAMSKAQIADEDHDIFLSHAFLDADIVSGVFESLEGLGYKVYIDWKGDPQLNRENVDKSTAMQLKYRMERCKCLLYVVTPFCSSSKWMPWELGYFDGFKGKSAILPVTNSGSDTYKGQELINPKLYERKIPVI